MSDKTAQQLEAIIRQLDERLDRIEGLLTVRQPFQVEQEWYSVEEVAELLGKRPFTVREWCRLDRINARKQHTGRGNALEWAIHR